MAPASTLPNWAQISSNKRDSRDELIPSKWRIPESARTNSTNLLQVPITCGILTAEEIAITSNFDAVALVEALKNSTFSAEAVTTAFCKRAAIAQQLVNISSYIVPRSIDANQTRQIVSPRSFLTRPSKMPNHSILNAKRTPEPH